MGGADRPYRPAGRRQQHQRRIRCGGAAAAGAAAVPPAGTAVVQMSAHCLTGFAVRRLCCRAQPSALISANPRWAPTAKYSTSTMGRCSCLHVLGRDLPLLPNRCSTCHLQLVDAAGQAVPWLESQLTAMLQSYNLSQVRLHLHSLFQVAAIFAMAGEPVSAVHPRRSSALAFLGGRSSAPGESADPAVVHTPSSQHQRQRLPDTSPQGSHRRTKPDTFG